MSTRDHWTPLDQHVPLGPAAACCAGDGVAPLPLAAEPGQDVPQRLPELAGGDGIDDGVHQAVGQLSDHDVVAQCHIDPGVGAANTETSKMEGSEEICQSWR